VAWPTASSRSSSEARARTRSRWELDRETGEFRKATDLGYQDVVDLDPRNGRLGYRPGMIPELDVELDFCPSFSGFKSWRAMTGELLWQTERRNGSVPLNAVPPTDPRSGSRRARRGARAGPRRRRRACTTRGAP